MMTPVCDQCRKAIYDPVPGCVSLVPWAISGYVAGGEYHFCTVVCVLAWLQEEQRAGRAK